MERLLKVLGFFRSGIKYPVKHQESKDKTSFLGDVVIKCPALLINLYASVAKLVDARDLKSLGGNTVPVRFWPEAPRATAISGKSEYFPVHSGFTFSGETKGNSMKTPIRFMLCALFFIPGISQATTVIDFEDIAPAAGITDEFNTIREISGFNFEIVHAHIVDSEYPTVGTFWPDNGTDYFQHDNPSPVSITRADGMAFSIQRMDASVGHSTFAKIIDFTLTGHLVGGGTISENFHHEGLFGFMTFDVDTGWENITQLDIVHTKSILDYDNIVFNSPVPVPATVWLFGSALGLLGWMRRFKAA